MWAATATPVPATMEKFQIFIVIGLALTDDVVECQNREEREALTGAVADVCRGLIARVSDAFTKDGAR